MPHEARQIPSWLIFDVSQKPLILTLSDELKATTSDVLTKVCTRIAAALPTVEVHHIGATAIPSALTKGDLDVVLRVEAQDFQSTIEKLRAAFAVKQPENWDPYFASFGSDTDFAMPVGVQLVIKDSEADFFLFTRDYLIAHPDALAEYNQAKQDSVARDAKNYWHAKDRILSPIIALKRKPANKTPEPTPGLVTPRALECVSEMKRRNVNRDAARGAPSPVVAHL